MTTETYPPRLGNRKQRVLLTQEPSVMMLCPRCGQSMYLSGPGATEHCGVHYVLDVAVNVYEGERWETHRTEIEALSHRLDYDRRMTLLGTDQQVPTTAVLPACLATTEAQGHWGINGESEDES